MAQKIINIGTGPNTGTGEPLRNAFTDINTNFTSLFGNPILNVVDTRDFSGIDPTGNNDSSPAIQTALGQALAANLPLQFPAGTFVMASVPIGYNIPGTYQGSQWAIFGSGGMGGQITLSNLPTYPYILGYNTANTVFINATKNLPTFCVNCVNGVWLKDFAIMGQNNYPATNIGYGCPLDDYTQYLGAGIRGGPSIVNSPYCAIAIDPLIKASPIDGGYPGLTYANSFGSNQVIIDNVQWQYFFVGLGLSTSGAVAENGSGVLLRNCGGGFCDTHFAIGQSQSRLFVIENSPGFGGCRQIFDGRNYGNEQGCPPSRITGMNYGFTYRVFNVPQPFGSTDFDKCYGESFRSFGNFGTGSNQGGSALRITGGDHVITQQASWPPPPPIPLESYGTTVIKGCGLSYSTQNNIPVFNVLGPGSGIALEQVGGLPNGGSAYIPGFIGLNKNMTSMPVMRECASGQYSLSDITPRSYGFGTTAINGRLVAVYNTRFVANGINEYQYQPGSEYNLPAIQVPVSSITFNKLAWPSASSITFNSTYYNSFIVGDILYWQALNNGGSLEQWIVPMLQVTSVTNPLVTCSLLFDPLCYDSVSNWNIYQAGIMFVAPVQWAPTSTFTATCNGTNTVTLTGGSSQYNIAQAGDWISDTAGYMPVLARVVSNNSGGGTLTLNKVATGSGSTNLYFGRLYPLALGTPI